VFHPLKANVDREVATTSQTPEPLNVSALVVPQTTLDYFRRPTVQTRIDRNGLKYNILVHMSAYLKAKLDSPNMLTFHFAVDAIWATATPTILSTIDDCVKVASRL
jgi:hypothetical protein